MIEEYKDKHKGERVFIIGTGPSLTRTPLSKLRDECTISMNKINKIYNSTGWRPTYYVFADFANYAAGEIPQHRLKNVKRNVSEGITVFLERSGQEYFKNENNINYFELEHIGRKKRTKAIENNTIKKIWSTDLTKKVYNFGSTVSVVAQIAHYMGFNKMYLVGTDLYQPVKSYMIFDNAGDPMNYEYKSDRMLAKLLEFILHSDLKLKSFINALSYKLMYESQEHLPHLVLKATIGENNHFYYDRFSARQPFHADHRNRSLRKVFKLLELAANEYGFDVYNATIGGYLEMFERVDIEKFAHL